MTMLIMRISCVQAATANTDISQTKSANVIDLSKKNPISEEDTKLTSKNVTVLKETDNEKVLSFKKDDGSTVYGIFGNDEKILKE